MFSGATIGKGLNRGLATFIAGALGVGAHYLASMTGKVGEPIFIGLFVFLQGMLFLVQYIYIAPLLYLLILFNILG